MKPLRIAASCWLALGTLAGCQSTELTEHAPYEGAQLARPERIIVHEFTADPAAVPADSAFAAEFAAAPTPTPQELEMGRRLGAEVAKELVTDLRGMGLPAVAAADAPAPQADDIVLRGYFAAVDEGSARERVLVGFGAGAAQLVTAVEGLQMTADGLRPLGRGEVTSGSKDTPGMAVPLAVLAVTANPIGLLVGGAVKLRGEATGSDTIEGAAEHTADAIAAQLRTAAEAQGWI